MKVHLTLFFALLLACTGAAQAAKIDICHIPPGNPGNWHTITINDTALPAHQAHGDLVGSCVTNCGTLCDDGNKCTIDVVPSNTECLCQAAPKPPVDCSDGRACTVDSCDPAVGCSNAAVVCPAPNLCTVSVCSEPEGTCQSTPKVCPTGQSCNANTGACESTAPTDGCPEPPLGTICPCAASPVFAGLVASPGTCFDSGTFIRKEVGNPFVSASCRGMGSGFCATSSGLTLETTEEEGTACVRLIRASCAP
jgi:hypothetical protein